MNKKIGILVLSFCIFLSHLTVSAVDADGETEGEPAILTIATEFGTEAAGEVCTVRIFRPGTAAEDGTQENLVYLNQGILDDDGKISFSLTIHGESGTYPCMFRTEQGRKREENLYYVSPEDEEMLKTQAAYALLDEDFNMLQVNSGDSPELSGWDILEDGGEISYSGVSFWLKDTDASKRLSIRRSFEPQSAGTLTLEFRFKQTTLQDDARWEICAGDVAVAELVTANGILCLNQTPLQAYQANTDYGIRLELDLTLRLVSAYINGVCAGYNIPLLSAKTAVDHLRISTGAEATGNMNVKPIRLYRGYWVQESWVAYTAGRLKDGAWRTSGDGSVTIEEMASTTPPDVYSVVLRDESDRTESFLAKSLQNLPKHIVLEFKLYAEETIHDFTAALLESLQLKIVENMLYVVSSDGAMQQVTRIPKGLWNTIQARCDAETGRAEIYVNGKKASGDYQFQTGAEVSELRFSTGVKTVDTIWLDDISLKSNLPLPEDYVPMPQTMEKSEGASLVGIQTCDIWHEGKHFGWDKVNQDYRRKPYLGFYDDGSSEVKDWEIKFMLEHGIDFSFHCWYRPINGMDSPIKTPRNGASIHDGYFNAQYRDKIKFAISWENGSSKTTNETDFRTNIVPFWMEYYFKDSNYLVLDNKPVVGIYNIAGLQESFGEENIAAQLDYLRQACQNAGFDGAWILGVTTSSDAAILQKFADMGFDAVYAYSWGREGYRPEAQKNYMRKQKEAGVIPIIPTLSMGRDDTPLRRGSGGFLMPGELKSLAEWTKEEFQPQFSSSELGRRMILLDNWNEYGEGHFFMPAELSGFDYLEAIAQVYGAPPHTDTKPTQQQTERLCKLYPQDRTVAPLQLSEELPMVEQVVLGWYFENGTEGFDRSSQITALRAQDGALSGTATGTDPQVQSPRNLNVDISNVTHIRVRMRNDTNDAVSCLYFATEQEPAYAEQRKFSWVTQDSGEEFTEYIIPVYKNPFWSGTLKSLRFDPSSGVGAFAYDSIELLGGVELRGGNLVPNGTMEQPQFPQSQKVSCEFSALGYHSGMRGLLCKAEAEPAEVIYPVTLQESGSYYATFYGRDAGSGGSAALWMRYWENGVFTEVQLGDALQLRKSQWGVTGGRFELPDGEITSAELVVRLKSPDTICYLDDVMLYKISDPVLSFTKVQFTDLNGTPLEEVSAADGKVIFTAEITNLSEAQLYIHPLLAAYQDGFLQQIANGQEIVLPVGASQSVRLEVEVNRPSAIKQFFWNREMAPIKKFEL